MEQMINLAPLRDISIVIDIAVMLWFYELRWYRLFSATAACVAVSLIVG